jgi:hypothetical protein
MKLSIATILGLTASASAFTSPSVPSARTSTQVSESKVRSHFLSSNESSQSDRKLCFWHMSRFLTLTFFFPLHSILNHFHRLILRLLPSNSTQL